MKTSRFVKVLRAAYLHFIYMIFLALFITMKGRQADGVSILRTETMKKAGVLIPLFALTVFSGCKKDNGFDAGGPISRYLLGRWELERIVTPTRTINAAQLGYHEILEVGNETNKGNYQKVIRDGVTVNTYWYIQGASTNAKAKDMTMTIPFNNGTKRFYKIRRDLSRMTLEASEYLPELGGKADSLRYFYVYLER